MYFKQFPKKGSIPDNGQFPPPNDTFGPVTKNDTFRLGPMNDTFGPVPLNDTFRPGPPNNTFKPVVEQLDDKGINGEFLSMEVYYLKYEYREKDMAWGISMILLCTLLIIICIFLNITVFNFYKKKARNDVVSLIYSLLSFADILVAVGASATVICLIQYLALDMKEKEKDFVYPSMAYSSYISFFISSISVRISIFLNALLSIVRTIMIRDPFSQPSRIGIYVALGLMTLFWTLLTAGEVYTQHQINIELHWSEYEAESKPDFPEKLEDAKNRKQYLYLWYYIYTSATGFYHLSEFLGTRLPWSVKLYSVRAEEDKAIKAYIENAALYGTFFIAFVVPCVLAIVCLVIQTAYLRKPGVAGSENNNKKVTNTIMMLTIVFVFCNTINIVIISIAMFYPDWFLKGSSVDSNWDYLDATKVTDDGMIIRFYRTMFVVQQIIPLLNSTLSPMILVWRGSALRQCVRGTTKICSFDA